MKRAACLLLVAAAPLQATDPDAWRSPLPAQPAVLFVEDATIWTSGPAGVLAEADLLVRAGKIVAVGRELAAPAGALVIPGRGLHVTAGILDAHSHIAIDGDVNESGDTVTAEVRVDDAIDPDDVAIWRQLAGGVTTSLLLHGSANAIGGQSALIKLRWGASPEGMLFAGAPPGIKLALGENPRKVNARERDNTHFPRTRPGVEALLRERFGAAREYAEEPATATNEGRRRGAASPPMRRDLELEALAEVLAGRRHVHAHSYRADEILMLLGLADEFGFKVRTLQHVLEGYKVADEIAAHGAGASTFSDFWGFKVEVADGIPSNGPLMRERGVLVSYNSDSAELGRRLNLEAAKAVRYGGLSPAEALDFVTINPARQLAVDTWVGSLEAGKDADFVVWSGPPLATGSLVLSTWIDGRRYFDRQAELEARAGLLGERQALIAKARAVESKATEGSKKP